MTSRALMADPFAPAGAPIPRNRRAGRHRRWWAAGAAAVLAAAAAVAYAVWPAGWQLVWHDEFNGSGVRAGSWNVRDNSYLPYEHSILTARPDNVRVGDGVLTI